MKRTGSRIVSSARVLLLCVSLGFASGALAQTYVAGNDFSTTQGYNNWYYLDWTGTDYAMMTYGATWWDFGTWHGQCSYTECFTGCTDSVLWSAGGHPTACYQHVPTLGWMSPADGRVHIMGNAHKTDPTGGDGVEVSILQNQALLWIRDIAYNDTTGYDYNLNVKVQKGDFVYFRISPLTNTLYDSTYFNPTIEFEAE